MSRKRRGQPVDGWIALDKPVGLSSAQAVARVRRCFDAEKAGHGGTLDPLASGILPIALGEATKTMNWAMDGAKRYRLTIRWGVATDTDDAEGAITGTSEIIPDPAAIQAALPAFTGLIQQVPSTYSAIKLDGRRAYELARAGEVVTLAARPIQIDAITLIDQADPDPTLTVLEVASGKGAYMRALARDLAHRLGTVGHLTALRRLQVGPFTENRAISLEQLEALRHSSALSEHLLPVETPLDDIPAVALTEVEALRLRQGQSVLPPRPSDRALIAQLGDGVTMAIFLDGRLVAMASSDDGKLRPMRILNRQS